MRLSFGSVVSVWHAVGQSLRASLSCVRNFFVAYTPPSLLPWAFLFRKSVESGKVEPYVPSPVSRSEPVQQGRAAWVPPPVTIDFCLRELGRFSHGSHVIDGW